MNKFCKTCNLYKNLSDFSQGRSKCKSCRCQYAKEYNNKYPYKSILNAINQRCYNPKSKDYQWYGQKGIKNYLTEEDIIFLMKRDNYSDLNRPSIDRKNHNKNYTLHNCRFIELSENTSKRNQRRSRKIILQYDLQGNFIKEFKSLTEASKQLNIAFSNISACIYGKQKTCGGFKWEYKL